MNRVRVMIPLLVPMLWVAVPAEAEKNCPSGSACVWDKTDFQGNRAQVPSSGCIDSNIRSAVNDSDVPLEFFLSGGCVGGRAGTLQPGEEDSRMSAASATTDCSSDGLTGPCSNETPSAP